MADNDDLVDAIEERFLQRRQQRKEQATEANRQRTEETAQIQAQRAEFNNNLDALKREISSLVSIADISDLSQAEASHRSKKAFGLWTEMQRLIRNTVDALNLPGHDVRAANATLEDSLAGIENLRKAHLQRSGNKFHFKSCPVRRAPLSTVSHDALYSADGVVLLGSNDVISDTSSSTGLQNAFTCPPGETLHIQCRKAVFVRQCSNSTIFISPTQGSVFLASLDNCTVFAACHQMRVKACHRCKIFTWCLSTPVIEGCDEMVFGPYDVWTGALKTPVTANSGPVTTEMTEFVERLAAMGPLTNDGDEALERHRNGYRNRYQTVDDFFWLKQQRSPHWRVASDAELTPVHYIGNAHVDE